MHRNHPQGMKDRFLEILYSAHNNPLGRPTRQIAHATHRTIHPTKSFTAPLNPRHPTVGAPPAARMLGIQTNEQQFPVRQVGRTAGPPIHPSSADNRRTFAHTRPETHQNLIHISKEQHDQQTPAAASARSHHRGRFAQAHDHTEFGTFRDTDQALPARKRQPRLRSSDH
jgi:hypothetical protein